MVLETLNKGDILETIQGIVLKHIRYKESSKIIYLYTPNGQVSVLVHGSQSMKSPYLNLVRVFSHVKLQISGKNLKTLRDGDVVHYYNHISENLERYAYAAHLMEVIYFFSNHDHDHEKLFQFLLKIMDKLEHENDFRIYEMMAELKLLYLLGVQPLFKHCVFCQNTSGLVFSLEDGGMVCSDHQQRSKYNKSTIELMMKVYYFDLSKDQAIEYSQTELAALRRLLDEYYEYHLNFKSKSRNMIRDMDGF